MTRLKYAEGDVFAIPLEKNGYTLGVVARTSSIGMILLGYFFDIRRETIPDAADFQNLRPEIAIWKVRIGDLHLMSGRWPIIGRIRNWNRNDWPMPKFIRRDPLTGRIKIISYKDDDPVRSKHEELVHQEHAELERDATYGAGVVEHRLSKLLNVLPKSSSG